MTLARTAAEALSERVAFELECVDRLYLNAFVPQLQTGTGVAWFLRSVRGFDVPSSVLPAP